MSTDPREEDQPVAALDAETMREWLATGAGADLTGRSGAGDAPAELLPPPGAPASVMRNTRVPWEIDQAMKANAEVEGISVSEWIRRAILAHLAGERAAPGDPVVELRLTLAAATRALDRLDRHQDAA